MLITISSGPGTPRTVLGETIRNGSAIASCAAATAAAALAGDAIGRKRMPVVQHTDPTRAPRTGCRGRLCCAVVEPHRLSPHRRGQLAVALAAVAWSTAGLFQRELTMDTITQLGGRAL